MYAIRSYYGVRRSRVPGRLRLGGLPEDSTITIDVAYRDASGTLVPKLDALLIVNVGN